MISGLCYHTQHYISLNLALVKASSSYLNLTSHRKKQPSPFKQTMRIELYLSTCHPRLKVASRGFKSGTRRKIYTRLNLRSPNVAWSFFKSLTKWADGEIPGFTGSWAVHSVWCFSPSQESKQKEALTRKQEKGKKRQQNQFEEEETKTELLARPKEYIVKFSFPSPAPLNPPILGVHCKCLSVKGFSLLVTTWDLFSLPKGVYTHYHIWLILITTCD